MSGHYLEFLGSHVLHRRFFCLSFYFSIVFAVNDLVIDNTEVGLQNINVKTPGECCLEDLWQGRNVDTTITNW